MEEKKMSDLKPCPFCGSGDIDVYAWENSTDITCSYCDYTINCYGCDEEDAADWWNHRPAEDAKDAEIERLKAALKDMCELWESMGTQIRPLLNERKYLNAEALVGKDINIHANAPAKI